MRYAICAALLILLAACGSESANNGASVTPPPVADGKEFRPPEREVPPGDARIAWKYQDELDKAVRWILDNQKDNGDWGYMEERPYDIYLGSINSLHVWGNASTALCCMGLLKQEPNEEINDALRKGLLYLVEAPDTPRATMTTFYNVWSHAYMIQALCRASMDERFADLKGRLIKRAEHEMRRLMDHQALDGGWGYYDFSMRTYRPSGQISTPFTTAAALVALKDAQQANLSFRDHNVQIGLDYLERHRIPNGAYYYSSGHMHYPMGSANQIRGSLGRSQSGDNGLFTWGRTITTDDLRAQLDTFFKEHVFIEMGRGRQFPHEAWYATAPYYYYFGHYYASRNALALPRNIRAHYGDKLAGHVVAGQYDDGSFWDYPLYGYHKPYGTGYAVIILSNCKEAVLTGATPPAVD